MLLLMTIRKRVLKVVSVVLILSLMGACGNVTPLPTVTATTTPSLTPLTPSITPSAIPSITPTPNFCNSAQRGEKIQILSNDLLTALEPGGPTLFDRVLVGQNPAWADFRQNQSGEIRSAGVIFHETAFGPELGTGINPAVLLVTYGVEQNWELPVNGDLVSEVDRIRAELHQYESDMILKKIDLSQDPVANGATYVLYRYFDGDSLKLEDWCHIFVHVFHESPLQ